MLNKLAHRARVWRGERVRQFLRKRRIDLVKSPHLGDFLTSRNCDLVIDVGANAGQFGQRVRELGYAGRMVSFEPVESTYRQLAAQADADWQVFHVGLGAAAGEATINVSLDSVFSSLKPLADDTERLFSIARTVRTETVRIERLDDVLRDIPAARPFLKIDVQGFEQEVLAGAPDTLARAIGLMIEIPVTRLYEGNWDFVSAMRFFDEAGFEPAQIRPVSMHPDDPVAAVEFDFLFRRKP
jgi:FkbM family methyltransferase